MQVTELAIERLREVMEEQGESDSSLRVIAMPAETGGVQYMLTMEKETQPDDTVLSLDGVNFLMDSDSAPFLEEATIDFVENFGGRVGFVINNPCLPRQVVVAAVAAAVAAAVVVAVEAAAAVAAATDTP